MSVRFKLEGIYTPVITPFHSDGEIDFDSLADLVERLVGAGVHGLISGGSTGENYAETIQERLTIARFIVDRVKGRIPVVIGTGAMRYARLHCPLPPARARWGQDCDPCLARRPIPCRRSGRMR